MDSQRKQNAQQPNPHKAPLRFDFQCMNCGKDFLSMYGLGYLGGWILHTLCGYETLFKPSTSQGFCEQIATRPLDRSSHSLEPRTTPSLVESLS